MASTQIMIVEVKMQNKKEKKKKKKILTEKVTRIYQLNVENILNQIKQFSYA